MVDAPCPPPVPATAAQVMIIQALLQPGPLDPALVEHYLSPAAVAAREEAEVAQKLRDWPNLCKYRAENAALAGKPPPRIVFIGDSITEIWRHADPDLFGGDVLGRGISGQTSPQTLVRISADAVALRPRLIHLLSGGNDIAGNTGPSHPDDYKNNIRAMVTIAEAHGIRMIIGSIAPSSGVYWRRQVEPRPRIRELNRWLREFTGERGIVFVDYHSALATEDGSFRPELSNDGVHPNLAGYAVMRPLVDQAMARAARQG
jgi:lysophospholipase L1-like esterase